MRIIELFAGIGACSTALKNLNINLEIVDAVELDKYAIKSFNAIHSTNFETQDILNYNEYFENIDLITHGSPCQDFSIAGKQAGGDLGSGTRSSLLYETIRIVGQIRPKYVLWENVKNILSEKHRHNFDNYLQALNILGYNNYYQVLNAKDYGVPQNRERVYTVSIRKDIDNNGFKFPKKEELLLRLKDLLENEVEEKYYLKASMLHKVLYKFNNLENAILGGMQEHQNIKADGICPTLTQSMGLGGGYIPMVSTAKCIKVGETTKNSQAGQVYSDEGISQTIIAGTHGYAMGNIMQVGEMRIRKLTPLECWRLMGFSDKDFEKVKSIGISDTQLYKQAR